MPRARMKASAAAFTLLVMDHVAGQPLSHAVQPDLGERCGKADRTEVRLHPRGIVLRTQPASGGKAERKDATERNRLAV